LNDTIIPKIVENLFNFKVNEEIKVSAITASRIFIAMEDLLRSEPSKITK